MTQSGRANSNVIALVGIGVLLLFALGTRSCIFGGHAFDFPGNALFGGFGPLSLLGLGGLLQVGLALWVGFDAHRRGLNGFLWGLLVLFTFIVGLIVYLIVGPQMARSNGGPFTGDWAASIVSPGAPSATAAAKPAAEGHPCPHCSASVQPEFKVCPYCAGSLRCASCDGSIQKDWKVCPRCGATVPPS